MNSPTPPVSQVAPPMQTRPPAVPAKGMALTALIVGIVAAVTAWVPVFGGILGILAIIFGAVALKKRQSKGMGVTGLILGVLATITSIIVTVSMVLFAGSFLSALEDSMDEPQGEVAEVEGDLFEDGDEVGDDPADEGPAHTGPDFTSLEPIAWDALRTEDAPLSSNAGSSDDPHQMGTRVVGENFEVVVNHVNFDATEQMLAFAPENAPPPEGKRYVLVHLTVNNFGAEPMKTADLSFYYDTPKQLYPYRTYNIQSPPKPEMLAPNQQITGNFSGYLAFLTGEVEGDYLFIGHDLFPSRQYVALQ